jgi:hypothetical protein
MASSPIHVHAPYLCRGGGEAQLATHAKAGQGTEAHAWDLVVLPIEAGRALVA